MRALLINPQNCSITEVDYTGDYKNIYTHIDAECFDIVRFGDEEDNTIYVDDNGLNNGAAERVGMFRVAGENPAYLAGKGLVLAHNADGESIATTMTIDALREKIVFGQPCRINGALVFLELRAGEAVSWETALHNRMWPITD
jgi:hypothetical protein